MPAIAVRMPLGLARVRVDLAFDNDAEDFDTSNGFEGGCDLHNLRWRHPPFRLPGSPSGIGHVVTGSLMSSSYQQLPVPTVESHNFRMKPFRAAASA